MNIILNETFSKDGKLETRTILAGAIIKDNGQKYSTSWIVDVLGFTTETEVLAHIDGNDKIERDEMTIEYLTEIK